MRKLLVIAFTLFSVQARADGVFYDQNPLSPGALTASMVPATDATYDLGSSSLRWRDLFISRRVSLAAGTASAPSLAFTAATNLGIYSLSTASFAITVSGVARAGFYTSGLQLRADEQFLFSSNTIDLASDTGLSRISAGVLQPTNGGAGTGYIRIPSSVLTTGTLTSNYTSQVRSVWHRYDWTNAMVVALGATGTGNIAAFTLPAGTVVSNAYVLISGSAAGPATVTVSLGRTGAGYIDYIVASDAKAAANTVYGDGVAERGTNLTGYDLSSVAGTTVVNLQFAASANLDTVTGSTGAVFIETATLP